MGFFGKLIEELADIVSVPVAAAKDIITLGGIATEEKESYSKQNLDRIKEENKDSEKK